MRVIERNALSLVGCDNFKETELLIWATRIKSNQINYLTGEFEVRQYCSPADEKWFYVPSGLLPYLFSSLSAQGVSFQYECDRRKPDATNHYPHAKPQFIPRPDQEIICDRMLKSTRGVCDLATNYGKTYLIARFWHRVNYLSMLVLVPTQALLDQTSRDIANLFGLKEDEIGRVGASYESWKSCTVGVVNSVADCVKTHRSLPYSFSALIIDEGHIGTSLRYQEIAQVCDAYYRFWMSGTAYKKDDNFHEFSLTALAGPLIARVSNRQMVEAGYSSRPVIAFIKNRITPNGVTNSDDFHEQYKCLKLCPQRNGLIQTYAEEAMSRGLTVMIFVEHKDHARRLHQRLPESSLVLGGQRDENRRVRKALESGEAVCVICTSAWRLGVSVPGVDVLIQACGKKSKHLRDQEFGRVLRKSKLGVCWYLDFMDYGLLKLRRHGSIRESDAREHGFDIHHLDPNEPVTIFDQEELQ